MIIYFIWIFGSVGYGTFMWESLIKRHLGARLGIFMYLVIRVGYFEKYSPV